MSVEFGQEEKGQVAAALSFQLEAATLKSPCYPSS
jgi:hypothetical protein